MNLYLFESEQLKLHKLMCDFQFVMSVINKGKDTVEKFYRIELSDEDEEVCHQMRRVHLSMERKEIIPLTSKYGDFFSMWCWCCRYSLIWNKESSYKRFLARRGVKEAIEQYETFSLIWDATDKLYGWGLGNG